MRALPKKIIFVSMGVSTEKSTNPGKQALHFLSSTLTFVTSRCKNFLFYVLS